MPAISLIEPSRAIAQMPVDFARASNMELLTVLLGSRSARAIYRGSLRPLFATPDGSDSPTAKCAAARELVKRWLEEDLRVGDALTSPDAVRNLLRVMLADREHEVFVAVFLDAQHRVIGAEELFRGTLTQTSVYPREVVKAALRANAAAVIFAHNHPSGTAQPSQADEYLTRNLKEALALVDVKVLDHFIVAGARTLSFAERGML